MAKRKLSKKQSKPKIRLPKLTPKRVRIKKILPPVLLLVIILSCFLFFKKSSYFALESVNVVDRIRATKLDENELLKIYKGRNIFDIDIAVLSSQVRGEYPVIKNARVKRVLPNRLEIDIVPRVPVAFLKGRPDFPVDRTGMLLSPEMESGELPIVTGVSVWRGLRAGERISDQRLEAAFSLVDALREASVLSDYKVQSIDASNYRNLSFYIENGIEVKIGDEDFAARLRRLKTKLKGLDLDKGSIKYIDLRFEDRVYFKTR